MANGLLQNSLTRVRTLSLITWKKMINLGRVDHVTVFLQNISTAPLITAQRIAWKLSGWGIVAAQQFFETLENQPTALKKITGMNLKELRELLMKEFSLIPAIATSGYPQFGQPPLQGLVLTMDDSPILKERREKYRKERLRLAGAAQKWILDGKLPLKVDLTLHFPRIGDQGGWDSCVGWGASAARTFPIPVELSPGWAYNGAKSLDGRPDIEGSWLNFAFEYFYRYGHLEESLYSYDDARNGKPMEPYHARAQRFKIDGFVDLLLDEEEFDSMPALLKGMLSGKLIPKLGPQPVAIGIAVYGSGHSVSTYRSGLLTIPMQGEKLLGGHAMALVGYIDRKHPDNPFGGSYFLVRNSWGTGWAAENPLGYAVHALIPEGFFRRQDCLCEAILGIAEVSPMKTLLEGLERCGAAPGGCYIQRKT